MNSEAGGIATPAAAHEALLGTSTIVAVHPRHG